MPASLPDAVRAGILAHAHLTAMDRVAAAQLACARLGALGAGRWRSAARDLERMSDELDRALVQASQDVQRHAEDLELEEEALWTVGEAAALFDVLQEVAAEDLEDDSVALRLLEGDELYGVTFLEDDENPDRGTTLLFGWSDPLNAVVWRWEATWIVSDGDDEDGGEELDLFDVADMEAGDTLVSAIAEQLEVDADQARLALEEVAEALTRASLVSMAEGLEDEEEDDEDDDLESSNGHRHH